MFADRFWWLGQCGAAQGHLAKNLVGIGDVFLFFGLFRDPDCGDRHHRFFGYMNVKCVGSPSQIVECPEWREPPRHHPHFSGTWNNNNTIYHGNGGLARNDAAELRLTIDGGPLNSWNVPPWLRETGLTYHRSAERWLPNGTLDSAKRGQEFIADVGNREDASSWLSETMAMIDG